MGEKWTGGKKHGKKRKSCQGLSTDNSWEQDLFISLYVLHICLESEVEMFENSYTPQTKFVYITDYMESR